MQRRLARLDSARKEFIANASHELRTPIFSLGGFVELLETENPSAASAGRSSPRCASQVERLQKLTADLLDLSKLDADVMEIMREPVDLKELAREIAAEFRPAAKHHQSRLEVGAGARRSPSPTPIGWRRSSVSCSTMRSPTPPRARR